LRVLGVTLVVAGLAEYVHASAAIGAFLVGLTLTGVSAERSRAGLAPLRDLFAAIFFVSIGLTVEPAALLPMLPLAVALAVVTAATKVVSGMYAASREGVARRGQLRAGTVLIVRGEFSLVIIALVGAAIPMIQSIAMPYVFVLAFIGPVATVLSGRASPDRKSPRTVRRARDLPRLGGED
ncbi:MAG: cation:proton antiporter, partial [Mycobacterium sp.]